MIVKYYSIIYFKINNMPKCFKDVYTFNLNNGLYDDESERITYIKRDLKAVATASNGAEISDIFFYITKI